MQTILKDLRFNGRQLPDLMTARCFVARDEFTAAAATGFGAKFEDFLALFRRNEIASVFAMSFLATLFSIRIGVLLAPGLILVVVRMDGTGWNRRVIRRRFRSLDRKLRNLLGELLNLSF